MSYMLLIMERADRRNGRPQAQVTSEYEQMIAFTKELDRRGLFKGAESLRSVAGGARVERRGGKTSVTNGVMLCPRHHTFAHDARYRVAFSPAGKVTFTRRT